MTAFFFLIAALFSGGGHTFASFIIFFPFAVLPQAFGDDPPRYLGFLPAFLQYAAYYLVIVTVRRPRQLLWRAAAIFIAHWLAVIACFTL